MLKSSPLVFVVLIVCSSVPAAAQRSATAQLPPSIKQFDTNDDGELSRREIAAARSVGNRRGLSREIVRRLDRNADGKLDARELAAVAANRRRSGDRQTRANGNSTNPQSALLKRLDTNGNGRLDPEERRRLQQMSSPGNRRGAASFVPQDRPGRMNTDKVIEKFDTNGNGQLDPPERQRALSESNGKKTTNTEGNRAERDAAKASDS